MALIDLKSIPNDKKNGSIANKSTKARKLKICLIFFFAAKSLNKYSAVKITIITVSNVFKKLEREIEILGIVSMVKDITDKTISI